MSVILDATYRPQYRPSNPKIDVSNKATGEYMFSTNWHPTCRAMVFWWGRHKADSQPDIRAVRS